MPLNTALANSVWRTFSFTEAVVRSALVRCREAAGTYKRGMKCKPRIAVEEQNYDEQNYFVPLHSMFRSNCACHQVVSNPVGNVK